MTSKKAPMPSRRRFFGQLAAGAAVGCGVRAKGMACPKAPTRRPTIPFDTETTRQSRAKFKSWLLEHGMSRAPRTRRLVFNFYDTDKQRGSWIYPMLSGKAILWMIQHGELETAIQIANTLIRWQQHKKAGKQELSYGAFPSLLEAVDGDQDAVNARYYAGDNLVILEALLSLYEKTDQKPFLNAAVGIGNWLTDIMCSGHRHGMWVEDHGAPMAFVTSAGDFSNAIHTSVELLWITALHRLGRAAGEGAYCRQADKAIRFYLMGQSVPGPIMDRYNPQYPAQPYSPLHWEQFEGGKMIADNVLRAALGLCKLGELDRARKIYDWLQVEESGDIPAVLDLMSGKAKFPADQEVYYDVSSTALHRSLAQWLGASDAVERDTARLLAAQDSSGAWYWGALRKNHKPVTSQYAPIVGFWATADLSVPMI